MAAGISASELAIRACNVSMPSSVVSALDRHAYAARLDEIYFELNDAGDDRAKVALLAPK